ncbi:uroporphyrinogen-III synthase [Rhizobium wuzhouense]|uniref:Uroporphyrinogen-III synthase n=1 Tax=Rhizobium wuzhouense TaxID=1986026 RepID=A0ABX5NRT7_9HYPH|nr:uroporphyrinogen-III synthase [Rhizobium wuzhouense]PYB74046.1 uroporphyrinogen III synthase [Rhizobium wuzhouense]
MRVLVTRPMPAAERTAAELRKRGHQPVLLPLMRAEHRLDGLRQGPPPQTAALAVTSAEAIRALTGLSEDERSRYLHLPLFAVGEATATAARDLGFIKVETGSGDGEALARRLLAAVSGDTAHPILYLAGTPRSPEFEQNLENASRGIEIVECYRMVPERWKTGHIEEVLTPRPDCILLYSSETARQFVALIESLPTSPGAIKNIRFLCLSHKIASALPKDFRAYAVWPMEPREDLLLDLL